MSNLEGMKEIDVENEWSEEIKAQTWRVLSDY
jgi:hypothetical protein